MATLRTRLILAAYKKPELRTTIIPLLVTAEREYKTKSGNPIEFSVSPAKDSRAWVVQTVNASVDGKPVGHLTFGYIPRERWDVWYPTVYHFAVNKEGHTEGKPFLDVPGKERELCLAILGFNIATEPTHMTNKRLSKMMQNKFGDRYDKFREYHLDKPQVEYIKSEILRDGIGTALYEYVARFLSKRGLGLWASSLQQPEAKAAWGAMIARGYPVKVTNGRMCLAY